MKRLKAFTILELTVAMLIASLCFAIAFKGYRIVTGTFSLTAKRNNKISTLVLTDKLLRRDFTESGSLIIKSDEGIQFSSASRQIDYVFTPDYILRRQDQGVADTLYVPVKSIRCAFEMKKIAIGERVDELIILTSVDDRDIQLSFFKEYSSEDLVNK